MIPYILAAVGGYLIGDSLKGKQFAKGGQMAIWGGVRGRLNEPMLSFSKVDYDVNVNPKNLEVDVNIKERDSVDYRALSDTGAELTQYAWGYMIYPKSVDELYQVLKALRTSVSKKRLQKYIVENENYAKGGMMADGGIPKEKSLLHFVLNEASSGSIANKTKYSSYKDIDAIRVKAVEILMRDGDREYSLQAFNDLIQEAVILIEEDELTNESEGERRIGMDYMSDGGWVTAKEVSEERSFYSDMYKDDNGVRPRNLSDEQLADWLNSNYKIVTKDYDGEKRKMIVAKDFSEKLGLIESDVQVGGYNIYSDYNPDPYETSKDRKYIAYIPTFSEEGGLPILGNSFATREEAIEDAKEHYQYLFDKGILTPTREYQNK